MEYILTHTPTQSFQNHKGRPVTYSNLVGAMAALVAWAEENNLPSHDFVVSEYKIDRTKFAYNPNRNQK